VNGNSKYRDGLATGVWFANYLSVVSEERSTLGVSLGLFSPTRVSASCCWNRDDNRGNKQGCHDGEGEDPLKCHNLSEELSDTNGGGENAQVETHSIILVRNDEKQTIGQNRPNEDVAKDAGNERFWVGYHDGPVPVNGNKVPCKWSGYDSLMDETSVSRMTEVERGQVEEVDNDQKLSPAEVASHEQHDETKVE